MKYWQALVFYLAAFFLQPFIYGLVPSIGMNLNLMLCLTIVFTFVYNDVLPGLFFGPIFGMLTDMLYSQYTGPTAFAIAVVGILVFIIKEYINIENVFNAIITMMLSTWMFVSVLWVIYYFIGHPYSYMFALKALPMQLILNTVVGIILYSVLIRKVIKHRRDRYFR